MDFTVLSVGMTAVLLASFFATVSGFGYALICMPLLSMVLPIKSAVIFVPILTVFMRVVTMVTSYRDMDWRVVASVCAGCLVGIVPGSLVLKIMPAAFLGILLGSSLIVAVFLMVRRYRFGIANLTFGRFCAGLVAGFFGSATSVNGPPIALYFLNEEMEKTRMRANMIWIFGVNLVATGVAYFFAGTFSVVDDWTPLLYLLPANIIGLYLGEKFAGKVSQELFRRLSLFVVSCGALAMLVSSVGKII